jgi:hypothetical protein
MRAVRDVRRTGYTLKVVRGRGRTAVIKRLSVKL